MQFRKKRVMEGSTFDGHRAELSQQLTATTTLDIQRAKSSRQHVRALNTQFARSNFLISVFIFYFLFFIFYFYFYFYFYFFFSQFDSGIHHVAYGYSISMVSLGGVISPFVTHNS
jgi:hypothetical protein